MDILTFICLTSSFLLVAYFHREEKKKGNAGVLYIGGVFDAFWTLVESIPTGKQVATWLDKRFRNHEQANQKEQAKNKHSKKQPPKEKPAKLATAGVIDGGPEVRRKKSQKSKSSKRRSKKLDEAQKHKKHGVSSSQKKDKSKSTKRNASVNLTNKKLQPVEQ